MQRWGLSSLTTIHANNAEAALSRLANCAMQDGGALPWEVTCRNVVDGIAMVIHLTRREGKRFVEEAIEGGVRLDEEAVHLHAGVVWVRLAKSCGIRT